MLPPSRRLTSSADFREVVRRGHRRGGSLLVVHVLTRAPAPMTPAGAGFVVSKAVGQAVTRNLVKRRLRHLVHDRIDRLPNGALLVVRAQPAAASASYTELAEDLDRCLEHCLARLPENSLERPAGRHRVGAAS